MLWGRACRPRKAGTRCLRATCGACGREGSFERITLGRHGLPSDEDGKGKFVVHARWNGPSARQGDYFIGQDASRWHRQVPAYGKVKYEQVYPGVDLVFYGSQQLLEFDFAVAPGADASRIELEFAGMDRLEIEPNGDLALYLAGSQVRLLKPKVYQQIDGRRQEIAGQFVLQQSGAPRVSARGDSQPDTPSETRSATVGFQLAAYDRTKALVIDPVLAYSSFLGGAADEAAIDVAVDAEGNVYLAGHTASLNFPLANPLQPSWAGGAWYQGVTFYGDAFVTKLDQTGSQIIYSTYLGGSAGDWARVLTVDQMGNAYVAGHTFSLDFPLSNPVQAAYGGGLGDVFVAKLSPDGSALLYSTYLGGSGNEFANAIAVDAWGQAHVTGHVGSTDFPRVNALQPVHGGGWDIYITKLNPTGSALVYSTYLGRAAVDVSFGLDTDPDGNLYLAGYTSSRNFPTVNPFQPAHAGGSYDAVVAKLNPAGSALVFSTYFGGSCDDYGEAVAVDGAGNILLAGTTLSTDFPTVNAMQPGLGRGNPILSDGFAVKFTPNAAALIYSTYLGGSEFEGVYDVKVDAEGNGYLVGRTRSPDFPLAQPLQASLAGGYDVYVTKLPANGPGLMFSTYFGGAGDDSAGNLALDSSANVWIAGSTSSSTDFPLVNPLQPSFGGGTSDAFVARLADLPSAVVQPDPIPPPPLPQPVPAFAPPITVSTGPQPSPSLRVISSVLRS